MPQDDPTTVVNAWLAAANAQDADRLVQLSDPNIEVAGPRGSNFGHQVLRDWVARAGLTLETVLQNLPISGQAIRGVWFLLHRGQFHPGLTTRASARPSTGVSTVRRTTGQHHTVTRHIEASGRRRTWFSLVPCLQPHPCMGIVYQRTAEDARVLRSDCHPYVFAGGNAVVLEQHGVWRSLETGAVTGERRLASVFRVGDRRVVQFARFDSLDAALQAAGLPPADGGRRSGGR